LLNELNTFVYINGRPDHMKGQHDDLIMAMAMAIYVGESSFTQLNKLTEQTKAMVDSWSVRESDTSQKVADFNPGIPNVGYGGMNYNNRDSLKKDYMEYSWLFGKRSI
jgi:hypothetical protein